MVDAKKKKVQSKAKNQTLVPGIYRFGRGKMYHKKGLWMKKKEPTPLDKKPKKLSKLRMKEKPVGGENNGKTRSVRIKKLPAYYAAELRSKRRSSNHIFKKHARHLRPSLTPGTVCIVLAGLHKGKKVIFLKQLKTGLCLVTGPFKVNACPMRRINQIYLIATSTRLDISGVKVPDTINDAYFARVKAVKSKKEEGDIFEQKKEKYQPSEQRKKDQQELDAQILNVIKSRADKTIMKSYLGSMFGLTNGMFPHKMKF